MSNSPLVSHVHISPNRNSPRSHVIDTVSIHCMAGNLSIEACGNEFASPKRGASSNYGIGSDGRIGMYVEEGDRSWCSSNAANDNRAITIEVANDGGAETGWHVSDAAYRSLIHHLQEEQHPAAALAGRQIPGRAGGQAEHDRAPLVRAEILSGGLPVRQAWGDRPGGQRTPAWHGKKTARRATRTGGAQPGTRVKRGTAGGTLRRAGRGIWGREPCKDACRKAEGGGIQRHRHTKGRHERRPGRRVFRQGKRAKAG